MAGQRLRALRRFMKLESSAEWQLKGAGNANAVFAYAGSDAALVRSVDNTRSGLLSMTLQLHLVKGA